MTHALSQTKKKLCKIDIGTLREPQFALLPTAIDLIYLALLNLLLTYHSYTQSIDLDSSPASCDNAKRSMLCWTELGWLCCRSFEMAQRDSSPHVGLLRFCICYPVSRLLKKWRKCLTVKVETF